MVTSSESYDDGEEEEKNNNNEMENNNNNCSNIKKTISMTISKSTGGARPYDPRCCYI